MSACALVILLTCEMAGNYIYPVYYFMTRSASDDANPYRGAPYIDFLKAGTGAQERVFGREGDIASGMGEQLPTRRYSGAGCHVLPQILRLRPVLLAGRRCLRRRLATWSTASTACGWLPIDSPLKRRLLQLSSVKFLLSMQPYGASPGRAQEIVRQNKGRLAAGRENLVEVRTVHDVRRDQGRSVRTST